MVEIYKNYVDGASKLDTKEVLNWVETVLKNKFKNKNLNQTEVEHILDYLISKDAPKRLLKMSYAAALSNADKWSKAKQKKGRNLEDTDKDIKTIHEFDFGFKIVKLLSESAYKREGFLMRHCLGGYSLSGDRDIYSLRDKKNEPHCTLEVLKNRDEVTQIKGKGNGSIHPKYINYIMTFFETVNKKLNTNDMRNLGYYVIDAKLVDYAKSIANKKDKITDLYGNSYVFCGN
jgi:hypothetical protein